MRREDRGRGEAEKEGEEGWWVARAYPFSPARRPLLLSLVTPCSLSLSLSLSLSHLASLAVVEQVDRVGGAGDQSGRAGQEGAEGLWRRRERVRARRGQEIGCSAANATA